MVTYGKNFGQNFINNGKFADYGIKKLGEAGVKDVGAFQNWLGGQGNINKKNITGYVDQYLTFPNQAPPAPTQPEQATPQQPQTPQFPTNPASVASQAQSYGQAGANFLANGSPQDFGFKSLYNTANQGAQTSMTNAAGARTGMEGQIQSALDPRIAQNTQSMLDRNQTNRLSDIENLYSAGGQKMNDFQKAQASERANAFASGLFGSKEKASVEAELAANLYRDRAGQIQKANELSRSEELGQLDNSRNANISSAGLYGNMYGQDLGAAQNFLSQAQGAATADASADLGYRNLGKSALDSSLSGQLNAIGSQADMQQRDFENQLKNKEFEAALRGQILELIQQNKANKINDAMVQKMMGQL